MEKIFFQNKWQPAISKKKYFRKSIVNNNIFSYPDCSNIDLTKVISSAKKGLKLSKKTSLKKRSVLIKKISNELKKNYKLIAKLESSETGKIQKNCEDEILYCAKIWAYVANNINQLDSYNFKINKKNSCKVFYEPVGIVSLIIPWNFPMVVASERLPFILAAGNSVIIKPSEYSSQSIIYLVKLLHKAKFPNGTVNLIFGKGSDIGKKIVRHSEVNMVSFTGSTAVGKKIMASSSATIKRLSLELGGKNSMIVLSDAKIFETVKILIESFCLNTGQCCVGISKLIIHNKIKDKFIKLLISELKKIKNFEKLFGPITTEHQYKKIYQILNRNKKYKKNIIFGDLEKKSNRYIYPIVYENLPINNQINKVELFAPILSICGFEETEEAIKIANNTNYGLSTIICGSKKNNMIDIIKKINSGRVWINKSIKENYASVPIGGYKESGLNRECGKEGFKTYSELKSIIL